MSAFYDDQLGDDKSKIRLRIGDTQRDKGPRPDGRNFSDNELAAILSDEGSIINAAIAHCFEILANEWTSYAISEREGDAQYDAKEVADKFAGLARTWRDKPGGGSTVEQSSALIVLERNDAYSDPSEYVS